MGLDRPFRRTIRPFLALDYEADVMCFVRAEGYADSPRNYIRPFLHLQRDIRGLYEYIEPDDNHLETYSDSIGKLIVTACFEVESNLKAILRENGHKVDKMNMSNYCKLEETHRLSDYKVLIPEWIGGNKIVRPFESWSSGQPLPWYQNYNAFKHDRVANASSANFSALIHAWAGFFVLLTSQFFTEDFSVDEKVIGWGERKNPAEFQHGIGGYLKFIPPLSWTDAEKYDFPVSTLFRGEMPFASLQFQQT